MGKGEVVSKKKDAIRILDEWSLDLDKDFYDSLNRSLNADHYRDLLDDTLQRVDQLNAYLKRPWYRKLR